MTDHEQRLNQTERHLVEAKKKNTGVQPHGQRDKPETDKRPPNPGQTIVNSDQSYG
jgi:hypothetical protein